MCSCSFQQKLILIVAGTDDVRHSIRDRPNNDDDDDDNDDNDDNYDGDNDF